MEKTLRVSITSATIVKAIIWGVIFVGLIYLNDIIITLLVAVVLASAMEPAILFFKKYSIPRGLSVFILILAIILIIVTIAFIFVPPLADDIAKFINNLPTLLDSIRVFGRDMGLKDLAQYISQLSKDVSKGQILTTIKNTFFVNTGFFATTSLLFNGIFKIILTFVLSFYLAAEERGVHKFLKILTPNRYESYIEDLWDRAQKKISLWIQGQLLISLSVSLLVYIPTILLGIPYASLLAVLAFIGELIPMVGLTLAMVPAFLLAWIHGGPQLLGIIAIIYFIISQIESHILYPRVMSKMVGVPSVVVIIAMVVGAKFAGIWGVLLAVPLASVFMELIHDLEKRKANAVN